jgi:ubiquinone/menaquinone biosynthesis C-methylase UbiE
MNVSVQQTNGPDVQCPPTNLATGGASAEWNPRLVSSVKSKPVRLARQLARQLIEPGLRNEPRRVKWIRRILLNIPTGASILDAGCGEQQFRTFCSHLRYTGQDFAQYDGVGDSRGLQTGSWDQARLDIVSDIVSIPRPAGAFEAIMCTEVFEHIPDPIAAVKEFSRLIKPGGYLVLTAPFCSLSHFTPYHFQTGFNRYWYEHHLPAHGFAIEELETNGNFFEYLAQELVRLPSVAFNSTSKSAGVLTWAAFAFFGLPLIQLMGFLGRRDQKSSNLLCFGYHVLARKM